jgi:hypothetical protein
MELVWGDEVRDKRNQSCLYITGKKNVGSLEAYVPKGAWPHFGFEEV